MPASTHIREGKPHDVNVLDTLRSGRRTLLPDGSRLVDFSHLRDAYFDELKREADPLLQPAAHQAQPYTDKGRDAFDGESESWCELRR